MITIPIPTSTLHSLNNFIEEEEEEEEIIRIDFG